MAEKKRDYSTLTPDERAKLGIDKKEEMLKQEEQRFELESAQLDEKMDKWLGDLHKDFEDIDSMLARKSEDVDILFVSQSEFLNKNDFLRHLKKELEVYISYFDPNLSDEEFDAMWDRIAEIENKYKRLITN